MIGMLPPVRNPVPLARWTIKRSIDGLKDRFPAHRALLCRSGTDALAAAIAFARTRNRIAAPEVVVPAYGCPDLVAACYLAGAVPRLVDIDESLWAYDFRALQGVLSDRTVAILAVNLLGLGDDAQRLKDFSFPGVTIIQDSAQHVPFDAVERVEDQPIVLSFGRGKPANSLGGGALLIPDSAAADGVRLNMPSATDRLRDAVLGSRAASALFNIATTPLCYKFASSFIGGRLGATIYRKPDVIAASPVSAWKRIGPSLDALAVSTTAAPLWMEKLPWLERLSLVVPQSTKSQLPRRLLRFPLLAPDRLKRDALVRALSAHGIGASEFYATALPGVMEIPEFVRVQGPFPNAQRFADRLFTLPTHRFVDSSVVQKTMDIMGAVLA